MSIKVPEQYKGITSINGIHNRIIADICKRISPKEYPTERSIRYAKLIVRDFFRKATPAILNGYPIKIYEKITIALHYEPIRKLAEYEKKSYFFSSKVIDYMFCIKLTGKAVVHDIYLVPTKIISKKLQDILDSNLVYQFIKNETDIY